MVDYCELITPTTAQVLGTYESDFYKGMPALLKNSYKAGTAYYIGCRDAGEMSDALYEQLLDALNIRVYDLPEGVTVSSREEYLFVQNFNEHSVTLELPCSYRNVQTDERVGGLIHMEPFSILVICAE